jgi:hypothetical protein
MRLTKLLRRNTRVLLMVFMSLLLIVFLIGPQLEEWARQRSERADVFGQAFGRQIDSGDLARAQRKQELLRGLGIRNASLVSVLDLHLLLEEARQMGVRVGRDEVMAMFRQASDPQFLADLLAQQQQRTNMSYNQICEIVGEWLAVEQLVASQMQAFGSSLPRAELDFRYQQQKAAVKLSVIDARALLSEVPDPTEEELLAFFEEHKERTPAHTEDELVFGYRLPDRVRIEYLTVDPQQIEPRVRISEREVQQFFEEHAGNYTKLVSASEAGPADQIRVPMTYEEAREQARADWRREKAIREAQRLMNEVRQLVYQPWMTQPRDQDGFRAVPPMEVLTPFADVPDKFAGRHQVTYVRHDLLDEEGLQNKLDTRPPMLRQYMGPQGSPEPLYVQGQTIVPLSELAFRVEGLIKPTPDERLPVLRVLEPSDLLQNRTQNGTLRGPDEPYQAFVFRVVEVQPSGPPASLDEVRDQVVADYRLLKAYELAGRYAEELGARARVEGLAAAAAGMTELKALLQAADENWTPPADREQAARTAPQYVQHFGPNAPTRPFTRMSSSLQWVSEDSQKVQREAFEAAAQQPPGSGAGHTVAVVRVANLYKWVTVEVESVEPLYEGRFAQQRAALLGPPGAEAGRAVMAAWLQPENIHRRCGFVPAVLPEDLDQPTDEAASSES